MTFEARMKAPTYPDADQSARARPRTKANPAAPRFEAIDSTGPRKVSAAESGPISVITSVTLRVVVSGSPIRPMIETSAISAGNSASRP